MTDLRRVLAVAEDAILGATPKGAEWPKGEGILALLQRAHNTLVELSTVEKRIRRTAQWKSADLDSVEHKLLLVDDEELGMDEPEQDHGVRISRCAWLREKGRIELLRRRLQETRQNLSTALSALTMARL